MHIPYSSNSFPQEKAKKSENKEDEKISKMDEDELLEYLIDANNR